MDIEPVMDSGDDDVNSDSSKAYKQLTALAEEQRKLAPWLSAAQCFARVFQDNPELAVRARCHPQPNDWDRFPRQ
jgi:hypothetical protein